MESKSEVYCQKQDAELINTGILHDLGYRIGHRGMEIRRDQMKILELERIEDGSVPDFCYISHNAEDKGFIIDYPFEHFLKRAVIGNTMEQAGEGAPGTV